MIFCMKRSLIVARLEDMELNAIADVRLKDGRRLVRVKLDEL